MIFNVKIPIFIIKNEFSREKNKTKGFNFLVATDGSKISLTAFKILKDILKENDKVYTVNVYENE